MHCWNYLTILLLCGFVKSQKKDDVVTKDEEMKKKQLIRQMSQYYHPKTIEHFSTLFQGNIQTHQSLNMVVGPRRTECLHEDLRKHDGVRIVFESMSSDTIASFIVLGPDNKILIKRKNPKNYETRTGVNETGTYSFCFENSNGYKHRTVHFLLEVREYGNIAQFHLEQRDDENNTMYHLYDALYQVQYDIMNVFNAIGSSRRLERYDWMRMKEKAWMILCWSIILIITIIVTSVLQVYYLQRLFVDSKPRRPFGVHNEKAANIFQNPGSLVGGNGMPISNTLTM